jgi:hypothetical protein
MGGLSALYLEVDVLGYFVEPVHVLLYLIFMIQRINSRSEHLEDVRPTSRTQELTYGIATYRPPLPGWTQLPRSTDDYSPKVLPEASQIAQPGVQKPSQPCQSPELN